MKTKEELADLIAHIASADSPVGMDAVYVHALILDKLTEIERRLGQLEQSVQALRDANENDAPAN